MSDLDQLNRLRPDVADPSPAWLAANRAALLEHAAASRPARHRGGRGRVLMAAAAGVAVLAVIALVLPAGSKLVTANQPLQFVYVKQGFQKGDAGPFTVAEAWYPVGSGTAATIHGDPTLCTTYHNQPSDPVVTACPNLPPGAIPPENRWSLPEPDVLTWSYRQYQELPTDADRLRARLYELARKTIADRPSGQSVDPEAYAGSVDQEVFILIGGILVRGLGTPELAAALHQVLVTVPGTTVDQHAQDATGRPGVGYSHGPDQTAAYRTSLLFDQDGRRFLGVRAEVLQPHAFMPSIVMFSSGLVAAVGDRL